MHAIAAIKGRGQERRQRSDEATREYAAFLQNVATPVVQQVASALKAEGYAFTVFTPGDGLRLVYDRGRHDFIDFVLETSGDHPQVVGRIIQSRGSQRLEEERPIKLGVSPAALTDEDVLDFIIHAIEPWLAR